MRMFESKADFRAARERCGISTYPEDADTVSTLRGCDAQA